MREGGAVTVGSLGWGRHVPPQVEWCSLWHRHPDKGRGCGLSGVPPALNFGPQPMLGWGRVARTRDGSLVPQGVLGVHTPVLPSLHPQPTWQQPLAASSTSSPTSPTSSSLLGTTG